MERGSGEKRKGWKDYRCVWEWLMEFPSLWAPIAEVTKGLLKEQGLLQEKDARSGRQAEAVGAGAHGGKDRKEAQREGRLSDLRAGITHIVNSDLPPKKRLQLKNSKPTCVNNIYSSAAHLIVFHTLNPSSGLVPLVLPPARPTRVGSQSEMWMSSWLTVPGCFSSGLATNPTPRIPPSHRDHFLPRSGQLLPPLIVWPPLSGDKM